MSILDLAQLQLSQAHATLLNTTTQTIMYVKGALANSLIVLHALILPAYYTIL
jgi:hypothetical protein